MKKILFTLSAIALMAIGCNKDKSAAGGAQSSTKSDSSVVTATDGMIAYVNVDSLISKYKMYIDLRAAYEAKTKKADAEVSAKGRNLQSYIQDCQNKVDKGLVTRAEAATMQETIGKRQEAFVAHRDQVMNELAEEEQVMLNKIHFNITEYLKEFNKDYRYKVILSTTTSGPILNADPSLDITEKVLEGLNKEYVPDKNATKTDKADTQKAEPENK